MVSGQVNDDILCKNLDSAIDVYLSRVDKSPCARTVIHLMKGADSDNEQKEREIVIKFLKGKAEDKKEAKLLYPDLYQKVESIWQLRQRHMVKGLPIQYVFYLRCCFVPGCIHPVCQSGASDDDFWYPNGPSLDFFSAPTPDPERPFGNLNCRLRWVLCRPLSKTRQACELSQHSIETNTSFSSAFKGLQGE